MAAVEIPPEDRELAQRWLTQARRALGRHDQARVSGDALAAAADDQDQGVFAPVEMAYGFLPPERPPGEPAEVTTSTRSLATNDEAWRLYVQLSGWSRWQLWNLAAVIPRLD